jgi:outer membrane protein
MMKKSLTMAAALLLAFAWTAAAELRIATVDLDKVFQSHPKTQKAEEGLKAAEVRIRADMEKMAGEARALQEEAQKLKEAANTPMLSESARMQKKLEAEDKLTQLEEMQLRIRRTQESRLKQLRDQLMKTRQGIVDELMGALKSFAEEEGYDLVFDTSGLTMNAVPLAVYADKSLDVTERIVERIGGKLPEADADKD